MTRLVLGLLAVSMAQRARRHGYHLLWSAGKLVRLSHMASAVGWLRWAA